MAEWLVSEKVAEKVVKSVSDTVESWGDKMVELKVVFEVACLVA